MADRVRSKTRRIAVLGMALAAATALTACLGPLLPGECSDEERAAYDGIEHYGAVSPIPEDDALGGCRATFESEDDPQAVIEHYESAMRAAGWTVDRTYEGPMEDESGNPVGTVYDLAADKGPVAATITGTEFDGEPTSWIVLVRRVST